MSKLGIFKTISFIVSSIHNISSKKYLVLKISAMEKSLTKIFNYLFHINLQIIIRCTSAKHINITPPLKKKKVIFIARVYYYFLILDNI